MSRCTLGQCVLSNGYAPSSPPWKGSVLTTRRREQKRKLSERIYYPFECSQSFLIGRNHFLLERHVRIELTSQHWKCCIITQYTNDAYYISRAIANRTQNRNLEGCCYIHLTIALRTWNESNIHLLVRSQPFYPLNYTSLLSLEIS